MGHDNDRHAPSSAVSVPERLGPGDQPSSTKLSPPPARTQSDDSLCSITKTNSSAFNHARVRQLPLDKVKAEHFEVVRENLIAFKHMEYDQKINGRTKQGDANSRYDRCLLYGNKTVQKNNTKTKTQKKKTTHKKKKILL